MDQVGVVAVVVVAYGLVSRLLERTPLTVPLAFTAAGMAAGGLGLVEQDLTGGPVLTLLELTLVVVLFSDAARIDLGAVRRTGGTIPLRLLGLGMPLTIGLGVLAAAVLLEVVSSRLVPVRIRQAVNVESGLNDGLSVPFLTLFVALAVEEAGEALDWVAFTGQQIGLGVATGVVVGLAGGAALEAADRREWVNAPFRQLTVVALAVLAWAGADAVGGNGFIAAFVAGLATGAVIQDSGDDLLEFTEDEGQLLTAVVFFVFGVAAPGFLEAVSPAVVVYAALSLTVLRMLPVAIALLGSGLRPSTVLLLGWFGPRGLASIILALVVAEEAPDLPHLDVVMAAMALTVLASTVLHGATARPLVQRYGHFVDRLPADAPELTAAADLPVRGSLSDPPG